MIKNTGTILNRLVHILPQSHVLSFSRPGTGIYFVTLVHIWNIGDFLFTTDSFFSQFSIKFF